MFYKLNILLFLILLSISCAKPNHSNEPYTLTASTSRYEQDGDDRGLLVNVVLTNNTKDTLKYISWTCPENSEYSVKSDMLEHYQMVVCNATFPQELDLAPHKSKETEVELFFKNSFHGGAIRYQMLFKLYNNPKKYFKMFMSNHEQELTPKTVQSNVVDMYVDSDF
jgi:hypothetical protein